MSYQHLNLQEREVIHALRREGCSLKEIARQLGRDRSTISRELKRNAHGGFYGPHTAEQVSQERRRQAKRPWKMKHPPLKRWVLDKLRRQWSPEVIAAVSRREHAEDPRMQVSASAIYAWIDRDYQQRGKLWRLLPNQQNRKNRRRRLRRSPGSAAKIVGRVGIEQRPKVVQTRGRFGDWEGDTVHGTRKSGESSAVLLTQVERKSRYLLVAAVANRTASDTALAVCKAFHKVPRALRKTMTLDNGAEFAGCPPLAKKLGMEIYYADPCSAWQRGANEQVNGLLRRFFPKKQTDFAQVSAAELKQAVDLLNRMPRKCLQYRTPHEVFWEAVAQQRA